MERLLLGLFVLSILVTVLRTSSEHMTNKDLMDTLKTFGNHGTSSKKKTSAETNELPVYGPKGVPSPPAPKPSSGKKPGSDGSQYPEIYGPDVILTPGKPSKNGKHESDSVTDSTYEFNPDLKNAFPTETNEPQPYLNDFSKIQR